MGNLARILSDSFRKTLYNPEIRLLTSELAEDLGLSIPEELFEREEDYLYIVECLASEGAMYSVIVDGQLNIRHCIDFSGEEAEIEPSLNLRHILESAGYSLKYLDLDGLWYDEWYDETSDEFVYLSEESITFDRVDLSGVYESLCKDSEMLSLSIRRYEEVESRLGDPDEEYFEDDEEYGLFYDGSREFRDMNYYIEINSENGLDYFSEELPAFFYDEEDDAEAEIDNVLDMQTLLFRQIRAMRGYGFVPEPAQLERLMENAASGKPAIIFIKRK